MFVMNFHVQLQAACILSLVVVNYATLEDRLTSLMNNFQVLDGLSYMHLIERDGNGQSMKCSF